MSESPPKPFLFLNRHRELAELAEAVVDPRHRIVALVGESGMGKTALAGKVTATVAPAFGVPVATFEANRLEEPADRTAFLEFTRPGQPGRRLAIVDHIDKMNDPGAIDEILGAASGHDGTTILALSRRSIPRADITVELGPLPREDVIALLIERGLGTEEAEELSLLVEGNPRTSRMVTSMLREATFAPGELIRHLRSFRLSGITSSDGTPLPPSTPPSDRLRVDVSEVNTTLLQRLEQDPSVAYKLSSRRFEVVVAELLARQGYAVELTPASRDGGKDIYVARRHDLGSFLYLVECKRYAPDRPVGVEVVRALYGTVQLERATAGILVTTSTFTKGARDFERQVQYQLSLRDYATLSQWARAALGQS